MKTLIAEFRGGDGFARVAGALRGAVQRPKATVQAVPVRAQKTFATAETRAVEAEFDRIQRNY